MAEKNDSIWLRYSFRTTNELPMSTCKTSDTALVNITLQQVTHCLPQCDNITKCVPNQVSSFYKKNCKYLSLLTEIYHSNSTMTIAHVHANVVYKEYAQMDYILTNQSVGVCVRLSVLQD